jgi:hypothetical protein
LVPTWIVKQAHTHHTPQGQRRGREREWKDKTQIEREGEKRKKRKLITSIFFLNDRCSVMTRGLERGGIHGRD